MHIAAHCITDLRSLRAVIKAIRATGNPCTELLIPLNVWIQLNSQRSESGIQRVHRDVSVGAKVEDGDGLMVDDCFVY